MNNKTKAAAAAILAILVALGLWAFWPKHHHPAPTPVTHHAACWAKPGVIGYAGPGKFVPIYVSSGTRHGPGSVAGICG